MDAQSDDSSQEHRLVAKPRTTSLRHRPDVWVPTFLALIVVLVITTQGQPRALSEPLRSAAAVTATGILQAVGAPSQLNGDRIITGDTFNRVTAECSGMEIMVAIALLTFTFGRLFGVSFKRTAIATAAMVGVAFLMNSLRIASISLVAWHWGVEVAWGAWHDVSAYLAFGFSYGLMFLVVLRLRANPNHTHNRHPSVRTASATPVRSTD